MGYHFIKCWCDPLLYVPVLNLYQASIFCLYRVVDLSQNHGVAKIYYVFCLQKGTLTASEQAQ